MVTISIPHKVIELMAVNLPTELLLSFTEIVDSGSMLRATERVFLTQSALSLQIKRLEETVQTPLFHRDEAGALASTFPRAERCWPSPARSWRPTTGRSLR